jgi:hypothetical protein
MYTLRFPCVFGLALAFAGCRANAPVAVDQPDVSSEKRGESMKIVQEWRGRVQMPLSLDGDQPALPPLVIGGAKALAEFVDLIPTARIQMRQPAPPSDDPLLSNPEIDFSHHQLLVAFRTDSMYVGPDLSNPRVKGDRLVVDVAWPPLGANAYAAARVDIGTYHAILVEKRAIEVDFLGP